MNFKSLSASVAAAGLLAFATQAAAAYDITYVGTVNSGYDQTGLFGTAGQNLAGLNFSETFHVDPTAPDTLTSGRIWYRESYGHHLVSPSVTINGITKFFPQFDFSIDRDYRYDFSRDEFRPGIGSGFEQSTFRFSSRSEDEGYKEYVKRSRFYTRGDSSRKDYHPSFSLLSPPSYSGGEGMFFSSYFELFESYFDRRNAENASITTTWTYATLHPTSFSASGGVPEPASWALMLIGFFGMGAALRRNGRIGIRGQEHRSRLNR